VSGEGPGPRPRPEPSGPRASRWRDPDWWLGRTPEQRGRREQAREEFRIARADLQRSLREPGSTGPAAAQARSRSVGDRIGRIGRVLTIVVTLPIVGAAFFGPIGLIIALVVAVLLLIGRAPSEREGQVDT
jgi:hypothetical protein